MKIRSLGGYAFASWSNDGEKIGLLYYADPPETSQGTRTYYSETLKILDLCTESDLSGIEAIQNAALSPDGSSFLFSVKSGEYIAVYRVHADGSGLTCITPETLQFDITFPVWSPDGKGFVAYLPAQEGALTNAIYVPTVFDLSGKIIYRITMDDGGKASSWVDAGD
jgi:hypothetical protein